MKNEEKKTPRADWLRQHGITIGWSHVSGDPGNLGSMKPHEYVEFCIILRKPHDGSEWMMRRPWMSFAYSMGVGNFRKYINSPLDQREVTRPKMLVPDLENALYSLISGCRDAEQYSTFQDYVDEYGNKRDGDQEQTMMHYETWEAIRASAREVRRLLGDSYGEFTRLRFEDGNE